jgi:DNA primase
MSNEQKLRVLSSVFGDYSRSGKEILFYCPSCKHHKKKLSINLEKDKFKCWICDFAGNSLRRLVRRYANNSQKQEWYKLDNREDLSVDLDFDLFEEHKVEETKIELPAEFASLCNKDTLANSIPVGYLKNRGIDKQDILKWKIGYCSRGEHEGRIVIPSFNKDGYPNFFISRRYMESVFPKYKNPSVSKDVIFNELYLDFDEDLVITEGVFDAIKAGDNAVPILGSTMNERSKLFQKIVKYDTVVYMALDPDAEEKENKIIESLLKYGIEVYKIDVSPYKDVGEMPKQEFQKRKKQAQLVDNDNYFVYRTMCL